MSNKAGMKIRHSNTKMFRIWLELKDDYTDIWHLFYLYLYISILRIDPTIITLS